MVTSASQRGMLLKKLLGTSVVLNTRRPESRCTKSGTGSSSVLMPLMAWPDSFCKEVNVPHSWMTKGVVPAVAGMAIRAMTVKARRMRPAAQYVACFVLREGKRESRFEKRQNVWIGFIA